MDRARDVLMSLKLVTRIRYSHPALICAETGPTFALPSSASTTQSSGWMEDAEVNFYGHLAFWYP